MSVDWSGYEPFDPGVTGPLHALSADEARRAFDDLMSQRAQRIDALRDLLARNGHKLDRTGDSIQSLNDWFRREVEADPQREGRLAPRWYSVVNDVALFLGDIAIERNPHLRWVFFDGGKRDLAYQRHVIMGFSKAKNRKYNVDIDLLVATYAHRVIGGLQVAPDEFRRIILAADQYA